MKLDRISVCISAALAVCLAQAQAAPTAASGASRGFYLGVGGGWANSLIDYDHLHDDLQTGRIDAPIYDDDQSGAWRVFAGWPVRDWLAVEASWFDLGRFTYGADLAAATRVDGHAEVRGAAVDAVMHWPMWQRWSALARVGAAFTRMQYGLNSTGVGAISRHGHDHDWTPKVGLGLQYDVTPRLLARVEWERYRLRHDDLPRMPINAWMLSVGWKFGDAPASATPAPAPVAAEAPQEAPPAPVAPVGASLKSSSFSEESLFNFDSAELRDEGRQKLQALAGEVSAMPYAQIRVIGHASPSGTDEYNMRLSQRRAMAVRDELVRAGLDAGRLQVEARGEREPVTQPGQCPGNEATDAQTRQCHQPDRRVRIEVNAAP